jgi:hypothetical protein
MDDRMALQETLEQYDQILDTLREEYEDALKQGIRLPSFEALTHAPDAT